MQQAYIYIYIWKEKRDRTADQPTNKACVCERETGRWKEIERKSKNELENSQKAYCSHAM